MDVKMLKKIIKLQLKDFGLTGTTLRDVKYMNDRKLYPITQKNIDSLDSDTNQFSMAVYVFLDDDTTRMHLGTIIKPSASSNSMFTYTMNTYMSSKDKKYPPKIRVAYKYRNKQGRLAWKNHNLGLENFLIKRKLEGFIDG